MATVLNPGHKFPAGTSVACYLLVQVEERLVAGAAPHAQAAVDTETVADDGTLTYDGVTGGEQYAAYASVSGSHRWLRFAGT